MTAYKQQHDKSTPNQVVKVIDFATGKVLPHAEDLEEAVIGSMLIDARGRDEGFLIIKSSEVFYKESHRHIFNAMQQLYAAGDGVDIMTVSEKLKSQNLLDAAGGDYNLIQLTQKISSSAHMEIWARILLQYFIKRSVIHRSAKFLNSAYDNDKDALVLLEEWAASQDEVNDIILSGKRNITYAEGLAMVKKRIEFLTHKSPEEVTGVRTGFQNVDLFTSGFQKQNLIIVAARPGMGKTSLMLSSVLANVEMGDPVGVMSAEMSEYELIARTVAMNTNFHLKQITKTGFEKGEYFITLDKHIERMKDYPIYIDDTPNPDISYVQANARLWKRKYGIKALYVDYLQLLRDVTKEGNREQEIAAISRKLKALAKELDIPVYALSQLSRAVESTKDKRPSLAHLRESGAIEQDADVVAFIFRPGYYGLPVDDEIAELGGDTELIFAKYRGGAPNTSLPLVWIGDKTKYVAPGERYYQGDNNSTGWEEKAEARPLPTISPNDAWSIQDASDRHHAHPDNDLPF